MEDRQLGIDNVRKKNEASLSKCLEDSKEINNLCHKMVASETISVLGRRENGYYTKEKKPGCARNLDGILRI